MSGSSTTPGRLGARVHAPSVLPSAFATGVGTGVRIFSEAQWLASMFPTDASPPPLQATAHGDVVSYSFIVSDLHGLLVAGLPAHCERFWTLPSCASAATNKCEISCSPSPLPSSHTIAKRGKEVTTAGWRYIVCRNREEMKKDVVARAAIWPRSSAS